MGFIEQRDNGRYRAGYWDPFGRKRSKTFDRRADATRWLREREQAKDAGSVAQPNMRVSEWIDIWGARVAVSLAPTTREKYHHAIESWIRPELGRLRMGSLTTLTLEQFIATMVRSGLSPATVHTYWRVLHALLEEARKARIIDALPAKPPLPKVDGKVKRFLDREEVTLLADSIDLYYRPMILFLAYTGLRIGEAAALDWVHVDGQKVTVVNTVTESGGGYAIGPVKTKASNRTVFMPSWVERQIGKPHRSGLVFGTPSGSPLRPNNWRARYFRPAAEKAGLLPLTPHDLRHTFASLAIADGIDPKTLQVVMGHTSSSFTLDTYAHLFPNAARAIADSFESHQGA